MLVVIWLSWAWLTKQWSRAFLWQWHKIRSDCCQSCSSHRTSWKVDRTIDECWWWQCNLEILNQRWCFKLMTLTIAKWSHVDSPILVVITSLLRVLLSFHFGKEADYLTKDGVCFDSSFHNGTWSNASSQPSKKMPTLLMQCRLSKLQCVQNRMWTVIYILCTIFMMKYFDL